MESHRHRALHLLMTAQILVIAVAVRTEFMADHCKGVINLSREKSAILELQLTSDAQYSPHLNCYTTVTANRNMRIQVTFLKMNINSFYHCPGDYLQIFDGLSQVTDSSFHFNVYPNVQKYCGLTPPKPVTSRHNNVTLRFVSNNEFHGEGFTLLLMAYHEGNCTHDEYRCHNSRCIPESLRCDDRNHCGDHFDHCPIDVVLVIGYVTACVILVVALVFLATVVRYRCSHYVQDGSYDYYVDDILPPFHRLSIATIQPATGSSPFPTSVSASGVTSAADQFTTATPPLSTVSIIMCQRQFLTADAPPVA